MSPLALKLLSVYFVFSYARPADDFEVSHSQEPREDTFPALITDKPSRESSLEEVLDELQARDELSVTSLERKLGELYETPREIPVELSHESILEQIQTTEEPAPEPVNEVYVYELGKSVPKRVFCQELGGSCFTLLTGDSMLGMVYPCCGRQTACDQRTGLCVPGYDPLAELYARPLRIIRDTPIAG